MEENNKYLLTKIYHALHEAYSLSKTYWHSNNYDNTNIINHNTIDKLAEILNCIEIELRKNKE